MKELEDRCCWKRCRSESSQIYFGIGLCMLHWCRACEQAEGHNVETRKIVYHGVIPQARPIMRQRYKEFLERTKQV